MCYFSLADFKMFSSFLVFRSFIIMYPGVDFSGLIMFGIHSAFWIYRFTSLAKFRNLSAINYSNTFSTLPFFASSSRTAVTQMLDILLYSHNSWDSVHLFPSIFSSCCTDWVISIIPSYSSIISLLPPICS